MARRVDDDVVARGGLEEDARRIDRDALRLLVLQRVEQERVLERLRVPLAGRRTCSSLPSGSEPVSASSRPTIVLLP